MENESRERQEYWRGIAIQQLRKLAETELAFSEMEAEARISESLVFGQLKPQPHVVQPARSFLLRQGEIAEVTEVGRGGRSVKLYTVAETAGRAKAISRCAGRSQEFA